MWNPRGIGLRVYKIVKGRPRNKCYSLDHCLGKNSLSHHKRGQVKISFEICCSDLVSELLAGDGLPSQGMIAGDG